MEPEAAEPEAGYLPWYVARTKPRQEDVARANLVRQGFEVYLPLLKVIKCVSRQGLGFEPMFPRYLFFRPHEAAQSIAPVRSTLGVTCVVRFGVVPAVLPLEQLESIRSLESRQSASDWADLSPLRPGKMVAITTGPLAGLDGIVSMVSRQRVVVLMRLLGEQTQVSVNLRQLRMAA
jgi:transcriptional antiterminator RfaH